LIEAAVKVKIIVDGIRISDAWLFGLKIYTTLAKTAWFL
jgi:hypothetical protein